VRTSTFRYPSPRELRDALGAAGTATRLPAVEPEHLRAGDWVLAVFEFDSSHRATAAAARVVGDHHGLFILFEQRDWERLREFSAPPPEPVVAIRDTAATLPEIFPPAGIASVLVVEDDRLAREMIRTFLEDEGWGVVALESAEEAIELLHQRVFALFVLDWKLPGVSGLELCVEIRSRPSLASVPVLFLTANTAAVDIEKAFAAGANDYVSKPVEAAEFRARVLALLSRSGQFRRTHSG